MRNEYKILVGRPEWKRPTKILRRKWMDIIKMDPKVEGCLLSGFSWLRAETSARVQKTTLDVFSADRNANLIRSDELGTRGGG
jgi:hypothetical protein